MRLFIISLLFLGLSACNNVPTNPKDEFHLLIYNLDIPSETIQFENWSKSNLPSLDAETLNISSKGLGELFYSDSIYVVHGYCLGEWGGALYFQHKIQLDSVHYLPSICPLMVDRREEGFYITESLAHLDGKGKIKFISSIEDLVKIPTDSIKGRRIEKLYPNLSSQEVWQKLRNQGDVLVDTLGFTFNLLFPYKNVNYLIYSDYEQTLLSKLGKDSLQVVDTLLTFPSWRYDGLANKIIDGYYHYSFKNNQGSSVAASLSKKSLTGDIYAKQDSIIIAYRE